MVIVDSTKEPSDDELPPHVEENPREHRFREDDAWDASFFKFFLCQSLFTATNPHGQGNLYSTFQTERPA